MGQASYAVKSDLSPSDPQFGKERRCGPLQVGPTSSEAKAFADAKRVAEQAEQLQKSEQKGESEELARANDEITRLKSERDASAEKIRDLEELVASLQSGDQSAVEGKYSQMQQRLETTISTLKNEKSQIHDEVMALSSQLQQAQSVAARLEAEKEEWRQKAAAAQSEYAAREQEYLSRKAAAEGHVASADQLDMSQEQLHEQIRSLEAMHEALKRDFGRTQQEAHELEEQLAETRGLYHSKSQEKLEVESKLRDQEENQQQIERRLGDEITRVKQLQESQAKKFMDLCKFWGDVSYTVSKKNQTFRVKDSKGVVLELNIEPKDYTLRDLIDAVNAGYRNRMSAQVAARKSTFN